MILNGYDIDYEIDDEEIVICTINDVDAEYLTDEFKEMYANLVSEALYNDLKDRDEEYGDYLYHQEKDD